MEKLDPMPEASPHPVNGCIPSGGIDDILGLTSCCSGAAVAGSGWCLDQTDWGTNWASCVQTCQ